MTQVHSSGGAQAPFATSVSKGKAQAARQPEKKIAVPKAVEATSGATAKAGTQVTFGEQALHALETTGAFVGKALLAGVEDVGEAAYYTVKTLGTGVVDVAKGLGTAVADGAHGLVTGIEDTAVAVGHGVVNVEHAMGDMWGLATQGANAATNLATALGTDAQVVATDLGVAATDVGVSAKALLAGVGSIASTAANYGTYVVKQTGKAISELT